MLKLEPAALSDVGRKRSNNQDFLGDILFKSGRPYGEDKLNERGHLFAVADGMGGYAGGEVASELAILTLFERYYNGPTTGDIGTDLAEAIRRANYQVHEEAGTSGRNQMGTTLTLVLFKGNKAIFGNVGDSRTYLIRQGIPERVTHDHSLVQEQIDAGVLTPEQAERSQHKNYITRAIGHREEVDPDLFEREVQPGDVALLCSDGLHNMVKEIEMGTIVATNPDLKLAVKQLVDLANERGGPDNISALAVRVEEVGEPLPSILNGREAVYNPPMTAIYSQTTTPVAAVRAGVQAASQESLRSSSTIPISVPDPDAPPVQPTRPMTAIGQAPRPGGPGLWIGLGVLVLLIAAIVAFVVLSGTSQTTIAPAPIAATATPARTSLPASPATSAVSPPPTVTPNPTTAAATASSGGSSDSKPASPGTTPVGRVGANSAISNVVATTGKVGGGSKTIDCQLSSANGVRSVQVQLENFFDKNSSYEIRLLSDSGQAVTADFQEIGSHSGLYRADLKATAALSASQYELRVKKVSPEDTTLDSTTSYRVEVAQNISSSTDCTLAGSSPDTLVIKL